MSVETLERLRRMPGWTETLENLAVDAEAIDRLDEADDRARSRTYDQTVTSSQSSRTIPPSIVSTRFNGATNFDTQFLAHLEEELLRVLGRAPIDLRSEPKR